MLMLTYFAHGGEVHNTALEASAHSLAWYLQLLLLILGIIGFSGSIWFVTRRSDLTVLLTAFTLLVAGFTLFKISPVVSVISITVGLIATLLVTLFGLGDKPTAQDKSKDTTTE